MKNLILKALTIIALVAFILAADGPILLMLPPAAWLILFVYVNYAGPIAEAVREAWRA